MSSVTLIPHGICGFVGEETGIAVALRGEGDEVLFASKQNAPLRWVKIGEFVPDPKGILSVEEAMAENDEEEDE